MKKRKINIQKIFCFISFIFIITCVFWYGGRLIYFYLDNKKVEVKDDDNLAKIILNENNEKDTFKQVSQDHYFYKNPDNNYLMYSNILWRIVKINNTKEITLISESPLTYLKTDSKDYENSDINKWLKEVFEDNLNNKAYNLLKNKVCIDSINKIEKTTCNKTYDERYATLPSLTDYINTGASNSFINNSKYTYLSNTNSEGNYWYINDEGKVDTDSDNDIYGIKVTITLSSSTKLISGSGTKDDPYKIEDKNNYFGSYVKLGNDIWRIYETNDDNDEIKLMLNDYIKSNNTDLTYIYSNSNYYHNDSKAKTLAYYLNNTYLNTLSYKENINTAKWANYYYDNSYSEILNNTIDTKVSLPSIGNIILNNELTNYFTNTGIDKTSNSVYVINNNGTVTETKTSSKAKVIPCISIKKSILTKGSGTIEDPYETE